MDRMKELIITLSKASRAYYQENSEIISNYEYDLLYDELEALEKESGIVLSGSPTRKVGFEVLEGLTKVRHDTKMLSLDKTKEIEKLKSFLMVGEGLLSWKLDGLTIVLKYNEGRLQNAVTRGNGEIGEDVTHNAKVFSDVPLQIKYTGELIIRGEAVISYSEFDKINEKLSGADKYKNPRNLCSGTVRQLNSEIVSGRNVKYFVFSIVKADGVEFNGLKSNQMEWLREQGFDIVEYVKANADNIEEYVLSFQNKIDKNDFGSDGLVLTYDSLILSNSLGSTAKFPKDSIAFKWTDEISKTVLSRVEWNTSRTGLINPVAIFESVELEGTTVSKASLHNVSIIESLQLGLGDEITVYKANMIIPQVAENLTKSNTLEIPKKCPVCDFETEIIKLREGKALFCSNPNCKAQLIRGLSHFVSRDAMNIEGLSEQSLEKFVEKQFIENYTDLYFLAAFEDQIKEMEGFGEKSYTNLIQAIEKSKTVLLPNFIYALGINQVGLSNAKLLCAHYDDDFHKIRTATEEELIEIDGFGEIISRSLVKYFANEKSNSLIDRILPILNIVVPEKSQLPQKLENKTFVITGDLIHFSNRKELQSLIESMGGKVTGSVTSKTTCLINNDSYSGSEKNKKAKELAVTIMTEEEFIQLFDLKTEQDIRKQS